jgi:GNAT superfamily N-acetyltransferase
VRTWQTAYRGLLPDEYLNGMQPEERARRYTFGSQDPAAPQTLVAVDGSELVGFATVCALREEEAVGELSALHVDPGHWGRRIGLALIEAARSRLFASGFRSAHLWLLVGNARAERFYRLDGWRPDGTRRSDVVWGATVDEIGFRRSLP